ncbi:MAG: hypothetical protein GC179_01000 [Anaerolineaceae bacterium]|nr:hypothetical protein [Anaerolineaceae bacterium]
MATQIQTMPAPLALPASPSGGSIITQTFKLFVQPKTFFRNMPAGSQWLFAVLLVLVITGFTATSQIQSSTSSTSGTTAATTSTQSSSFSLSTLDATSTTTGTTANSTAAGTASSTTATSSVSSDTLLMNGLIAICGVLVMWAGQTAVLSLITMLRGYAPQFGKSLQIAVWASLPLALMLIIRYIHFASGGSGGSLGLSLLLNNWSGYAQLPEIAQRILAVFTSNLTLFWLWNLLLLYLGARFALGGRPIAVALIIAIWIAAATIVPAFVGTPQTRTSPRLTTTTTQTQTGSTRTNGTSTGTTATTGSTTSAAQDQSFPGGGQPPSGGFPGAPGG